MPPDLGANKKILSGATIEYKDNLAMKEAGMGALAQAHGMVVLGIVSL